MLNFQSTWPAQEKLDLPKISGDGEAEAEEARAPAAGGRRSLATRRFGRPAAGCRGVRGRRLPAASVPRLARAAAAGALGSAGARHRRARAVLPALGRRGPRRPAVLRCHSVHARGATLRGHLRPLRQHRPRPPVAPVSSFLVTDAMQNRSTKYLNILEFSYTNV